MPTSASGTSTRARRSTVASVRNRNASSASGWGVIRAASTARSPSASWTTAPRDGLPVALITPSASPPMRAHGAVKEKCGCAPPRFSLRRASEGSPTE
jgi:hypothetical protein